MWVISLLGLGLFALPIARIVVDPTTIDLVTYTDSQPNVIATRSELDLARKYRSEILTRFSDSSRDPSATTTAPALTLEQLDARIKTLNDELFGIENTMGQISARGGGVGGYNALARKASQIRVEELAPLLAARNRILSTATQPNQQQNPNRLMTATEFLKLLEEADTKVNSAARAVAIAEQDASGSYANDLARKNQNYKELAFLLIGFVSGCIGALSLIIAATIGLATVPINQHPLSWIFVSLLGGVAAVIATGQYISGIINVAFSAVAGGGALVDAKISGVISISLATGLAVDRIIGRIRKQRHK